MKPTHSDSSSRQKAVWGNKRTLLAFLITLACLAPTMAAAKTQQTRGYTGAGIGIAALDSGVTSWHDDLTNNGDAGPAWESARRDVCRLRHQPGAGFGAAQ